MTWGMESGMIDYAHMLNSRNKLRVRGFDCRDRSAVAPSGLLMLRGLPPLSSARTAACLLHHQRHGSQSPLGLSCHRAAALFSGASSSRIAYSTLSLCFRICALLCSLLPQLGSAPWAWLNTTEPSQTHRHWG
jgi:hypothetical protein